MTQEKLQEKVGQLIAMWMGYVLGVVGTTLLATLGGWLAAGCWACVCIVLLSIQIAYLLGRVEDTERA